MDGTERNQKGPEATVVVILMEIIEIESTIFHLSSPSGQNARVIPSYVMLCYVTLSFWCMNLVS